MKQAYLDNAATTKTASEVIDAMLPFYNVHYGNPSAINSYGIEAKEAVEKARELIAKQIGAKSNEIIFTSGASESNTTAILGLKMPVACSAIEHQSVLEPAKTKKHVIMPFSNLNPPKKHLVSVMHANNETGMIMDIAKIAENSEIFHTDAVQSFGKTAFNAKKMNVSMASFSAHKIHGPKGVGVLYVKDGIEIQKRIFGGFQEFEKRAGTENVPGIVGFAKAVSLLKKQDNEKIERLKKMLINGLDISGVLLNTPKKSLCNIANFSFSGIPGETMVMHLNAKNIFASTGSACKTGTIEPSYVIKHLYSEKRAVEAVRFSLSRHTTKEEIKYAIDSSKSIMQALKKL